MWFDQVISLINKVEGNISFVVKNLKTNELYSHNLNTIFPSASIIKVPILLALFKSVHEKKINLNKRIHISPDNIVLGDGIIKHLAPNLELTLLDLAKLMIIVSDNTASNIIIETLGKDYINEKFYDFDLIHTILARNFMDFSQIQKGKDNFTSCNDMLKVFEHMYHNKDTYFSILDILSKQMLNDYISLNIQKKFRFEHKTGSLKGIIHDVGILYLPTPIFIGFFSSQLSNELDGKILVNKLGHLVYQTFLD